MKRFLLFVVSALYTIVGMNPALRAGTNFWSSLGPDGGRVQAIAVDPQNPDTVYAVAGGAIFKTTDGAANWTRVYSPGTSSGVANNPALAVAINPQCSNTVYAGTANGVFKTTDGGASWSMANTGLPKPPSIPNVYVGTTSVGVLAIDPQNPETIYADVLVSPPLGQTSTPNLFKSTDGGASWLAASSGLTVDRFNVDGTHFVTYLIVGSLAIDPQDSNTLYAACAISCPPGSGLFKSIDGGENWSASSTGLPGFGVLALAIDPQNPNTLYAAPLGSGLFKSMDGGASWSAASSGLPPSPIQSLAIDPQNPDTLYASTVTCMPCTSSGIYKSTDGGASWTGSGLASSILVDPGYSVPLVLAIDLINPNTIYAGTYDGIVKSQDAGGNWNAANSGLTASQIDSLTVDPQNADAFFATSQGHVFRTTDGGADWSEIYAPLPSDDGRATYPASMLVADPSAPGTFYIGIGGNSDGGGGILKSTDGGASWQRMPLPGPGGVRALSMDAQNPGTLYASVPNRALYKSTDGGVSWNEIAGQEENTSDTQCFGPVVIDPQNPSTLYVRVCAPSAGYLKSTDSGQTWTSLVIPFASNTVRALAIDPQNSGTLYVADYYAGVLKSTDGGKNWRAFTSGLPATGIEISFIAVNSQNSNIVYAASNDLGVYWSTNGGANWRPLNPGLTNLNIQVLLIDPRDPFTVYAGSYDGGVFAITPF